MYNDSYEEYIRTVLGYPRISQMNGNMFGSEILDFNYPTQSKVELEECYPEIYKVIYPMIEKRCRENTETVTRDLIDSMTNEIYMAIEGNEEVQININLTNTAGAENRKVPNKIDETRDNSRQQKNDKENRQTRQFRNRNLNDLIKILIIRELLGRPGFPGHRPPIRPRPPFPGGAGSRPPVRPPFPRGDVYNQMSEILENGYAIYEY